jgi:cytochrome bd-type quinol oxidase subunit 2
MEWWQWVSLLCFVVGMIYTMVTVSKAAASSDVKKDMTNAITNVTIVNTMLMLVLAGTAYFYLDSNLTAERPYVLIMLHLSLLISIISVSISSLQQLNST